MSLYLRGEREKGETLKFYFLSIQWGEKRIRASCIGHRAHQLGNNLFTAFLGQKSSIYSTDRTKLRPCKTYITSPTRLPRQIWQVALGEWGKLGGNRAKQGIVFFFFFESKKKGLSKYFLSLFLVSYFFFCWGRKISPKEL